MAPLLVAIFILLCLATGGAFVWGAPIFGVPLLLIALAVGAFAVFVQRASRTGDIHQERRNAQAQKTHFTERDRQTQV